MAADPTVLFCVGATKAGTSWLYRYLADRGDCDLRAIKELHYYDTIDFDDLKWQVANFKKRRAELLAEGGDARARQIADIDAMVDVLHSDERAYREYLFNGSDRLVADITPGYALLSQQRFAHMAQNFSTSKFVYLMRDPVERLWSHVRMSAARRLKDGETFAEKTRRFLLRICQRDELVKISNRGDYAGAVARLKAAIPADRLMFEFSERLYRPEAIARLCAFLGLPMRDANYARAEHSSRALAMTDEQRQMAAAYLAPQYAFVKETFGSLPPEWQANMVKVTK